MKKSLILMFILSLLGHIAAAGMLYVAGAYGVWHALPREGMDEQTGEDVVRVLWGEDLFPSPPLEKGGTGGLLNENPSSPRRTKQNKNVIPAHAGIHVGEGLKPSPTPTVRGLASHLRGNDGQTEEKGTVVSSGDLSMSLDLTKDDENPPPLMGGGEGEGVKGEGEQRVMAPLPLVPSHEGRGNIEQGFSGKTTSMIAGLTKEQGYNPPSSPFIKGGDSFSFFPPLEKGGKGGFDQGFSDESGENPVSSALSMASMETDGDCSRSAACMGADTVVSEVYARPSPGIDEAGSRGRGGQGEGLKTFLEMLRIEIERHKNYPPFARRNGIEGTAYLNFHIGDHGRPDGIIIEKSSGSKILDESAVRTLKGMERYYPVPEEIRELEITVPIAYRLVEDKTPPSP